ncbi:MAG: hypothetical protein HY048_13245 [Acidobacteria bacterium]|nr:hypothetical protein [Acidobacteriota bacterium]
MHRRGAHDKQFNQWTLAQPERGTLSHAIVMKFQGNGVPEMIAMNVTQNSGGRYDFINTGNSLPEKMKALATQMADDYKQASVKVSGRVRDRFEGMETSRGDRRPRRRAAADFAGAPALIPNSEFLILNSYFCFS